MAFSDLIGEDAGTITSGQRRFASIGTARLKPQVIEKLIKKHADACPVVALLNKLGKVKTVGQPTFYHFEGDRLPRVLEIDLGAGYTSGDTSIVVASGHSKRLQPNTILRVARTSEMIRVTAVNTGTETLTCTRGFGGSTAAALLDNDELHICGMADTDGNTAPSGISSEPTQVTNALQIWKKVVELSGRDINADNYGEDEKVRAIADIHESLMLEMETGYLFNTGISTSDPTMSAGFDKWVTTNVSDLAGVELDEQSWNTWLRNIGRYNHGKSMKRSMAFVGTNICEALDSFGRDVVRYEANDETLGIKAMSYQNSFMDLKLVRHGLFDDNLGSGASYGRWGGRALFINFDYAGRAVFKGRALNLYDNVELPGTDGKKWMYMADEGLWVAAETYHGIMKGCAALS